ncbi:MAG: hypothetical protein JWQ63_1532 [Mucilaginibacter sp.]|jgi:hypothetical protein|nr:hypothetical protein [Mucilaginibacter sp.]
MFNQALVNSAFIFYAMLITNNKNKIKSTGKPVPKIITEGPLCEKDEQAIAIERNKLFQIKALKKWAQAKKKDYE